MKVIYAVQPLPYPGLVPDSIFLAGPTPRTDDVPSWRPEALDLLKEQGFEGTVFVPEAEGGGWHGIYDEQVEWEWEALARAACVLFWIPRDLSTMPAFTSNVEFGFIIAFRPQAVVLGAPDGAPKLRYLQTLAREQRLFRGAFGRAGTATHIPQATTLEQALRLAQKTASRD